MGTTENEHRSAGGILRAAADAGTLAPIDWVEVDVGDGLTVTTSADALKASIPEVDRPLRLPVSYQEAVEICRANQWVVPTQAVSDAIWRAAKVRVPPVPLVIKPEDAQFMKTIAWSIRHNANIDKTPIEPGTLVADVGKDWVLDNGIAVSHAVNYGWRQLNGTLIQTLGHRHDAGHWDYSQVLRVVQRRARLRGETIDLLDYLAKAIQPRFLAAFR